jgi:CRP/FNR family transcriptional regulator, cyclic AMP receptor protein
MTSTESLARTLADQPFLSAIPIASLRRLAAHVQSQEYTPGHEIFREGTPADRFFLLRQGLVRLDIDVPGRGPVAIETLAADAALGCSWLFPPFEWKLSAIAVKRTKVLVFDAAVLRTLMAADPVIGYELLRRFASVMYDRLQVTRLRLSQETAEVPTAGVAGPWAGRRTTVPSWS